MQPNVDKIYICHWSKLTQRKQDLHEHLLNKGLKDFLWIEPFDTETWDIPQIQKEYPSIFTTTSKALGRLAKFSEISLTLKHCHVIKEIIANNYNTTLILEDDAVLSENFSEDFNSYITQLPPDWDIAWVGTCCGLHAPLEQNKNIYRMNGSRCTHAYIISLNGAKKILTTLHTADQTPDFLYNRWIEELNLNSFWFEPPLAVQNTKYETTIQNTPNR